MYLSHGFVNLFCNSYVHIQIISTSVTSPSFSPSLLVFSMKWIMDGKEGIVEHADEKEDDYLTGGGAELVTRRSPMKRNGGGMNDGMSGTKREKRERRRGESSS